MSGAELSLHKNALKMTYSLAKTWPWYFVLFASYILAGYFLSSLSFQSQIIPIWLPAGIALAGCYLWWWRFFPAVFIASFTFNTLIAPDADINALLSDVFLQNTIIAGGATLQAIVGSALLRYWLGNPINQYKNSKTLYFIFIVGILVNLISAFIGVSALSAFNPHYVVEDFQLNFIFWWLGDSLGVLLALPFILCLLDFNPLTSGQGKVRWIIFYSVGTLFIIIILLTKFFIANASVNAEERVAKEAEVIENGIYRQISSSIQQLSLLAGFVQQNPNISKAQFQLFVSNMTLNSNTLKAMSWNPVIKQNKKLEHEAELTQLYQRKVNIKGKSLAIDDKIIYVKFISPEDENSKAIGFNVYSNPSRKITLDSTMINYQPQATPIIQLVQSFKKEPAFLLFYPVFEQVKEFEDTTDKRLIGFATGVFLAEKIITNAIDKLQENLFYYEVFDDNEETSFLSNIPNKKLNIIESNKHFRHAINVAGQTWNIHLSVNEYYSTRQQHKEFFQFFLLLVIIAVAIITSLLLMNNRQLQLNSLVNRRTKSLKEAMKEAHYANKAKGQFLANMSHEIRTPMNSVIGFAQLAKVSNDMSEIKSYISNIDISSGLLLHIINNILDISKIEAEKLVLTNEEFDMHIVLHRICSVFEADAAKKDLSWQLKDNIPEDLNFSGDPTRITQVLINLCGNAIKFTARGSIIITAEVIEVVGEKAKISITVQDTGIGIPQNKIETLFNPFTQADTSTSRDFGGTGLGLTIAKKLSQLMAGDITIESKESVGTCFIFTCCLPISNSKPKEINSDTASFLENQHIKANKFDTDTRNLAELKVLVAEDNRINQKLIKTILTKLGIDAVIVENGQLAINYLQVNPVDIILMDCQMPILDGYQATEQIRAIPEYANLPIFALTADVDTRSKEKASSLGFTKHLAKPINIDGLTEALLEVLDTKKRDTPPI